MRLKQQYHLISHLFLFFTYLFRQMLCLCDGQFVDFDGNCKDSCTGATIPNSCESNNCQTILTDSCISCINGYFNYNDICNQCNTSLNCSTCNSSTSCLTCSSNLYLKDNVCVSSCGNGYFQDNSAMVCQPCNPANNCMTCPNSVDTCGSCGTGKYLDNAICSVTCSAGKYIKDGSCVASCGSGYYLNNGIECLLCNVDNHCETCQIGGTICLTCNQLNSYKYKLNNSCVINCGAGYYFDTSDNNICKVCTSNLNCSSCNDALTCSACTSNYYLKNSSICVQDCGIGFYKDDSTQTCLPCNASKNCESCLDNNTCLTCSQSSSYQYLMPDQCALSCGNGYQNTTPLNVCKPCNPVSNCKTCPNSVDICESCDSTKYLDNSICSATCSAGKYIKEGSCVSFCGSGYYLNNGIECLLCNTDNHCETCQTGGTICLTCNQQSQYQYKLNDSCVISCGTGYYFDSSDNNICKVCTSNLKCSSCNDALTCSACISNYYLKNSSICVQDCGIGFYKDISTQTCLPCNASKNCESCQNNNTCLTCSQSSSYLYLMPDQCTLSCGNGYYNTTPSNICQPCDAASNCKTCQSSSITCDSCDQTSQYIYLKNNKCVTSCGDTYYADNNFICQPCNINLNCKTCTNPYTCSSCGVAKFVKYGVCVDACGDGFFPNGFNECQRCTISLNCKSCQDELKCLTCDGNSSFPNLLDTKCVAVCPSGYYSENNICKICQNGKYCATCTNSGSTCLSCVTDSPTITQQYLINGRCDNQCGNSYYTDPGQFICKACISGGNCLTCNNSTTCLTCDTTSVYKFKQNGVCTNNCGAGQYGNVATNQCTACNASLNCLTCADGVSCSACDGNSLYKYMKNNSCVSNCGDKYYPNAQNNCISCLDINCITCPNSGVCTLCDQTSQFKYLRQSTCQTSCGDYYYPTVGNVCAACNPSQNCKTCNDLTSCTSCLTNQTYAYLRNGICQASCGQSQYADDNKVCNDCNPLLKCLSCSSIGCTACDPQSQYTLLQSFRCVSQCSNGYYVSQDGTQCILCNSSLNCQTCTPDGQQCLSCSQLSSFSFLQAGQCVSMCGESYYADSTQNFNCVPCNSLFNCKTCADNVSCTSCDQGGLYKYLNFNQCVMHCDNGQFIERYACKVCLPSCKTCQISTECTSCDPLGSNPYLKDSQCVSDCGFGYYVTSGRVCQQCQQNLYCKTCSQSSTQCDSCYQDVIPGSQDNTIRKYLQNNQCQTSCGSSTYANAQNACQQCPWYCQSCSQPNSCDVCQQLAWKNDLGICQRCNPGEIITGDGQMCISKYLCSKNPFYVVNQNDNLCITKQFCLDSAPNTYFSLNGVYYQCLLCIQPYIISSDRTQCLQTCPQGEIKSGDTSIVCTACASSQITNLAQNACIQPSLCIQPNVISVDKMACISQSDCQSQDNSYILINALTQITYCKICQNNVISNNKIQCLAQCPTGEYQINGKKTCKICIDATQPICKCSKLVDTDGNCVDTCPLPSYINTSINTKKCILCPDFLTYDQQQCVRNCPVGFYLNSPISNICIPCYQYVTQNGFSCVQQCSKITDIDNRKCVQDVMYCPSLISADGKTCSTQCINGEVQIQDQKQCAVQCPPNYIRDIRGDTNICIPSLLCIGRISSDQSKCLVSCSDILEVEKSDKTCTDICPSNQTKMIQDDLSIACIESIENQQLNNYGESLSNFNNLLHLKYIITQQYKAVYVNALKNYINQLTAIINLEKASKSISLSISQRAYENIQSIAQTLISISYNQAGTQIDFNSDSLKITSAKLKSDDILLNKFNLKQFMASTSPPITTKMTDMSQNSNISHVSISYLQQNIYCKEFCSDKYGYFQIDYASYQTNVTNNNSNRILESTSSVSSSSSSSSSSSFEITFELGKGVNINDVTCASVLNDVQSRSLNTVKDKNTNSITCRFQTNVFLINDVACAYQDVSNCKENQGQTQQDEESDKESSQSSSYIIGLVIGISLGVVIIIIASYLIHKRRQARLKAKKYIESNNNSKTNDQEQLKSDVKIQI